MRYARIRDIFQDLMQATKLGKITWSKKGEDSYITYLSGFGVEIERGLPWEKENSLQDSNTKTIMLYLYGKDGEVLDSDSIEPDDLEFTEYTLAMFDIARSSKKVPEALKQIAEFLAAKINQD